MVSAVRHNTRTAISKAKRSSLAGMRKNRVISPMGFTISRAEKDIATDTLVRKTVLGRKVGVDPGYDYLMGAAVLMGAGTLLLRNRFDKKTQMTADVLGAGALIVGAFHLLGGESDIPL